MSLITLVWYNVDMKCLIYKVITPNNKVYIGLTSTTLKIRKECHLRNKQDTLFTRAIKKYGDEIVWEVIEDNIASLEKAQQQEIYWISFYQSNSRIKGYNLMSGGGRVGTHSDSTKEKIRKSVNNHYKNSNQREILREKGLRQFSTKKAKERQSILNGSKTFFVFNKKTKKFIGEWINKAECARELGLRSTHISTCLTQPEYRKSHGGYTFTYNPPK